ncbi:hypothetical protein ACOMHN_048426 [Nucella lapillus]
MTIIIIIIIIPPLFCLHRAIMTMTIMTIKVIAAFFIPLGIVVNEADIIAIMFIMTFFPPPPQMRISTTDRSYNH